MKEVKNLDDYEEFQEIVDDGQETIGSHWVIMQKEKHDRQKTEYKVRLVARGFQETVKPQSDSLTISKESFKLLMTIAANNEFELASVDIRAAFLQAKVFNREIFMKPPEDIQKPGFI